MTLEHMGVAPEIWPVAADEIGIWLLSGGDAWRGDRIPADSEPHFEVEGVLWRHGVKEPALLHSTSWRPVGPRVVLTYMAVVEVAGLVRAEWPNALPISADLLGEVGNPWPHGPAEIPVPRDIDVLFHGLRHCHFLLNTDSSARDALTGWWRFHLDGMRPALAGMYEAGEQPMTLPTQR